MKNLHLLPTEEQKQHIIDIMKADEELGLYEEAKKETIEEAAEKYADFSNDYVPMSFGDKFNETTKKDFINGAKSDVAREYWYAKWQEEQDKNKYTEEEVYNLIKAFNKHTLLIRHLEMGNSLDVKDWFEQFKKK
jgi:hypothetical protein